ncbi:MAG: MFS transporter [Archaeoglobi archaeon]|jgi:EmrB/QacA subfamily drug resistance transporter|nr:MAG: MFS transporter [Archaeoglobi archaeon]TDA25846.1 MAG: MFS transporter [Archaeoglobi archaeon]
MGKKIVLISSTIASFFTPFMASAVNVAIPMIEKEFEMDAILIAWISTAFLLSTAMFLIPMGRLGDIRGRKRIFILGLLTFSISSLLCSISTSGIMLIAFRFLQGIGASMIAGTAIAILTSAFPPQERGKVLGINSSAVYAGLSLGPFVGGVITQNFGWRLLFAIPMLIALIPILLALRIEEERIDRKENFDLIGSALFSIFLLTLILGFSSLPSQVGILLLVASILLLAMFVYFESKIPQPVLNVGLFRRNLVFGMSNLAALLNYSATFAVSFLLSLYLQFVKLLSPQEAGMIILLQPVVMATLSPISGWLSDRIEPRIVASIGMALTSISLFLFSTLDSRTQIEFVLVYLFLIGIGFGLFTSPNTNAVMSSVEKRFYGLASATLATMRVIGQAMSMGIVIIIFALTIGNARISENIPDFIIAMKSAFAVSAILCLIGVFASLARGKIH